MRIERLSLTPEQVRKIRNDRGWSIRQAAIVLGVSRGAWEYYEKIGISNGFIAAKIKGFDTDGNR